MVTSVDVEADVVDKAKIPTYTSEKRTRLRSVALPPSTGLDWSTEVATAGNVHWSDDDWTGLTSVVRDDDGL